MRETETKYFHENHLDRQRLLRMIRTELSGFWNSQCSSRPYIEKTVTMNGIRNIPYMELKKATYNAFGGVIDIRGLYIAIRDIEKIDIF